MTGVNIALLTVLVTYGIVCQTAERTDTFKTSSKAVARIADRTASQHLCARGHVRSSGTWLLVSLYAIFYWWSFGTKPLSLTVSEIFNVKCNTGWHDLDTTSRQRSRSFILVPIDFLYTGCQ